MAAALLRGLLLLALSRGLPLAAADTKIFSLDLPSIQYLKPNQNSTNVTFHIFANNMDNIVTRSLDEKWYAVELSKNENRAFVLRILPPVDSDFTCCTGVKLINFHASYEGKVQWNETCPEDLTEYCPGTESATSATYDYYTPDAHSTQYTKPPPTASDTGNSTTQKTKDPPSNMILWITLPTVIGVTAILVVFVACCLHMNSRKDQPLSDASDPPRSELNSGVVSEEEEAV
ncbi:uncharacterized protein LOC125042263 isoform X1 [Penaeus chinensis]|uniref:uncharacterized protein LOC125042263 isoform X1 n=1 Tax=Penaeus chinensis TaxID=139456 RepID=UPI001FB726DA|nr:uncharacterized protein LOC125042263 isoform X1 [Penaeus chinensis]